MFLIILGYYSELCLFTRKTIPWQRKGTRIEPGELTN